MELLLIPTKSPSQIVSSAQASLKQQAYRQLKRLILAGALPAGTVLSVRQLAVQLEMSRTPVHAAIERLEADGLVTLAPQHGVTVREMSLQDIVNHFQIRQALEPFVLERLAGRVVRGTNPATAREPNAISSKRRETTDGRSCGI